MQRDDVPRQTQALLATFERLSKEPRVVVRGVLLDLSDASKIWGPVAQTGLERMVSLMEQHQKRMAIVVGDDPLLDMQLRRLVRERATEYGSVFSLQADALAWIGQFAPSSGKVKVGG